MLCTDPYVPDPSLVPLERVLAESDVLFVATPHQAYRRLPPIDGQAGGRRLELPAETLSIRDGARDVKILVTGSAGFIAGYLVQELLDAGHEVDRRRQLLEVRPGRAQLSDIIPATASSRRTRADVELLKELAADCDHFIACAARIGGISYFHEYAYDLLAENERITAAAFDAAIHAHTHQHAAEDHRAVEQHGVRERHRLPHPRGARAGVPAAVEHLRLPEARLRVLRPAAPGSSTSSPTRSAGRSTASASARAGPSATRTSPAATSSWR